MLSLDRNVLAAACFAFVLGGVGCKPKEQTSGLVPEAGPPPGAADGGQVDLNQCPGCAQAAAAAWTFEGIYRDDACTIPLAQTAMPVCANVAALGAASLTYVDEVGLRKAGEAANVTLTEQIPPETPRFRKAGKACVKANETAVHVTPLNCAGQKVCRDATGSMACAGCRTFGNGCPDFEETRLYAAIDDPGLKAKAPSGGGGGNVARLAKCCAALREEAKRLGPSPEAGLLTTAAAQCQAIVAQAGPNGTAPELGAIRTMLAGRNVPAVCAGF